MLEHIMCSDIMRHLEGNNILHDAQHGFGKKRSCGSQLILTIQDLAYNIESKGQADVILIDFAKAFDKVPHKRLLYKLYHYGIRHSHLHWIKDFLVGRSQQMLLEGVTLSTAPVESPRVVCLDHSCCLLMTYQIVSQRDLQQDYLQMTVPSTGISERRRTPSSFKKT
ncbi:uncharacterized protein LOC130055030 [Ostrea edulis]|uniref:uncharacterized protein LOC130055030 n=1 Tax=Ostrea edulis TaxID=37623 RepID=UPI0024AEAAFB|nr:uncharacterized protein LOC130055030 [Ostrea edulis]